MIPSMSFGLSPASAMAASDASIWSAMTLRPELRLYAVSPTPVIAPLSRSDMRPPSPIDAHRIRSPGPSLHASTGPHVILTIRKEAMGHADNDAHQQRASHHSEGGP